MTTFLIAAAVAGTALLWRNYRYDSEIRINGALDRLPYLLQKPITCGLCFTFWISLVATIIFFPFPALIESLPYRLQLSEPVMAFVTFFVQWFALGALSTMIVYIVDTLFEASHYLKHAVGAHHDHK
jgi:hypothetical protein